MLTEKSLEVLLKHLKSIVADLEKLQGRDAVQAPVKSQPAKGKRGKKVEQPAAPDEDTYVPPPKVVTEFSRSFPVTSRLGESVWYTDLKGLQKKYIIAKQARRPNVVLLQLAADDESPVIEADPSKIRLANGKPFLDTCGLNATT